MAPLTRSQKAWLLAAAALSSSVALAAELLVGTLASYLVGNTALAYGITVGGFLAAMGVGAYVSQFIAPSHQRSALLLAFVRVELLIAPLTALLPLALFGLFVVDGPLWLGVFLVTGLLGILAGIEVPLLTRMIEPDQGVSSALAGVLALDYIGALFGSLLFPVVLLPVLGLFPTAALIGAVPALMVWGLGFAFRGLRWWRYVGLVLGMALCVFAPFTLSLSDRLEDNLYAAPIVQRQQSSVQRIVLTRRGQDLRLYLDGDLQLSTLDEYRYHEALVHPAMGAAQYHRRVLLLGAGDGMALREVLKWPDVEQVVVVELDAAVVTLAQTYPLLRQVNADAFTDPRVTLRYGDAFILVPQLADTFDVVIADFPDPDRVAIAKLYSKGFYQLLLAKLAPQGVFVTQASSPFFAPRVMDCIATTLTQTGITAYPYTTNVPSFGPWGFVLATRSPFNPDQLTLPVATRFLNAVTLADLFHLAGDIQLGQAQINRLSDPVIVRYQTNARWAAY